MNAHAEVVSRTFDVSFKTDFLIHINSRKHLKVLINYEKDIYMDDVNTFYALNPDVIFTYIDDEAVLMKSDGDEMYGVNPIGAEIWKKLEQGPMINKS